MSAQFLDGKVLAEQIKEKLRQEVAELKKLTTTVPQLKNVMIGDDAGAGAYANSQKRVAEQIGIQYELIHLPNNIAQSELIQYISKLNQDSRVHGIMISKPVPARINHQAAVNCIAAAKDLEGVNAANIGKMFFGETAIIPCTPAAVMEHIQSTGMSLRGKEAVIVGRSDIVGKPLLLLLLRHNATVTVCHSATNEAGLLPGHVGRADVVVAAVGKPAFIKGEWIKKGALVIDVGINQVGNKIIGDVEFESAAKRASYITPVPGGVGPVTVVMLMKNGIEAFKLQKGNSAQ